MVFFAAIHKNGCCVTEFKDSGSFLRRMGDFPVLVVSLDYELFFHRSGSIEKCLFEPTDLVVDFANKRGIPLTFYVDAGMLCCMERLAPKYARIASDYTRIKKHIASFVAAGHQIGLHIHPHWEETRWSDDGWDFSASRYRLGQFSDDEVRDIIARYCGVLKDICAGDVKSYRAGGFCIDPFDQIRDSLLSEGIVIDSSVVPGAYLNDPEKGFDFRSADDQGWWFFDESPMQSCSSGSFLEIPVTPLVLPRSHYWGRAIDRVLGRQPSATFGDGLSKAIGKTEIIRRLGGHGRTSELSLDIAKAAQLVSQKTLHTRRDVWHIMGHPKLLGQPSLTYLSTFIEKRRIERFESVSGLAVSIGGAGSERPARIEM